MQEDLPENAHVEPVQCPIRSRASKAETHLNRRAKTQQIAKAALELFLEAGVEKVTIDDLVNAANVAKGSFYRYFKDTEALVEALVQPLGQRALGALKRCSEAVEVAESVEAQKAAYLELAEKMAGVLFSDPDVLRLYRRKARPLARARAAHSAVDPRHWRFGVGDHRKGPRERLAQAHFSPGIHLGGGGRGGRIAVSDFIGGRRR